MAAAVVLHTADLSAAAVREVGAGAARLQSDATDNRSEIG